MAWQIEFTSEALREFRKLDNEIRRRIQSSINRLLEEMNTNGEPVSSVKRLKGNLEGWRLRVGDYRVRFDLDGDRLIIVVLHVAHRREVYREL